MLPPAEELSEVTRSIEHGLPPHTGLDRRHRPPPRGGNRERAAQSLGEDRADGHFAGCDVPANDVEVLDPAVHMRIPELAVAVARAEKVRNDHRDA